MASDPRKEGGGVKFAEDRHSLPNVALMSVRHEGP
jgi:hypothetical protein